MDGLLVGRVGCAGARRWWVFPRPWWDAPDLGRPLDVAVHPAKWVVVDMIPRKRRRLLPTGRG